MDFPYSSIQLFFAEAGQATMYRRDIISHTVWKKGTWVIAGGIPDWGGVHLLAEIEGGKKKLDKLKVFDC